MLNLPDSGWAALVVGGAILLGGETTCAIGYLLAERITRPVTALALAGGAPPPDRCGAPGVAGRLTMAWSLGTGVPLLGISVIAVASLFDDGSDAGLVAVAIVFLAAIGMSVGMLAISMAARSVAEPVAAVRRAIAQIEEGQLDVVVPVDDGSEVGLLEAGFNRMTAGLRERERLRDLFGRHVGRDVASAALENDGEIELGGEVREIAVLFVDMIGSTRLALQRSPADVVTLLNVFFCIVVEVVEEHGGWVNKFEGDAALCVFGAPTPRADPAADALRAARRLRERIVRELSGADASIGVSAGPAVAGNVGASERFEYTVIGDPVNEAARLCELAKQRPGRLLASDAVLERAGTTRRPAGRCASASCCAGATGRRGSPSRVWRSARRTPGGPRRSCPPWARRLPRRAGEDRSDREELPACRVRGGQGEDRRVRARRGGGEPGLLRPRRRHARPASATCRRRRCSRSSTRGGRSRCPRWTPTSTSTSRCSCTAARSSRGASRSARAT